MTLPAQGPNSTERVTPYHHGDLRNALIRAGLAILAGEGRHALSLRAVARHTGVSQAAPYRHFADKEALLAAIAEEGFHKLAAGVQEASERYAGNAEDQLIEAGWAYVRFALDHPNHLRVMFSGLMEGPYPELHAAAEAAFGALVAIIVAGQQAGVIVQGEPPQLALACWSVVHGLALLLLEDGLPPAASAGQSPEALTRVCVRLLVKGLQAQGVLASQS